MNEIEIGIMKNNPLHHVQGLYNGEILRVPGGWVYTFMYSNGSGGYDMSSCFVPEPKQVIEHHADQAGK